ncbi:MAG: response regulator transcription factor [Chthoniobacteraceae bacterium]
MNAEPIHAIRTRKCRILLVDDHPILHAALRDSLLPHPDLEMCGVARTSKEALQGASELQPDLALVDLSLPDAHGLQLIKQLRELHPNLRLLVFSMHDENVYGERALRAGADGYVMKNASVKSVVEAIRTVLAGEIAVSPALSARLLQNATGRKPLNHGSSLVDILSDRELEVFQAIGHGNSTKEIAARLDRSVKTIETHRLRIKQKLNIRSNGQLIARAACWVNESK